MVPRRYDRARALQFLAMIASMRPLKVSAVGHGEQQAATASLRRFAGRDPTLTDAVGLHTMRAQRVRARWSTDLHLGITGVPLAFER